MVGIVLVYEVLWVYGIKPEFLLVNHRWVSLALVRVQPISSSAASGSKPQQEHLQRTKTMLLPFQCVLIRSIGETEILLAASGSSVYSFDLNCGSVLSTWRSEHCNLFPVGSSTPQTLSSKPSPKPQNGPSNEDVKSSPTKSKLEDGNCKPIDTQNSNLVIKLAGSSNGQHIVAITEDKCVHVLRLSADGALIQLSER